MNYKEKREESIKKLFPKPLTGKGLVNSCIDKLPFELHLPEYNYAGPGTNLDLRLEKGMKSVNKLDEAAMHHDVAYSKSKNLADRHAADETLQEAAWKRFKAPDATVGEKSMAWLTTNAMKLKRAVGAGLRRKYTKYLVNLEDADKAALISATAQS